MSQNNKHKSVIVISLLKVDGIVFLGLSDFENEDVNISKFLPFGATCQFLSFLSFAIFFFFLLRLFLSQPLF